MSGNTHNLIDSQHLLSFLERIERIEEEIKSLQDDRKDIYSEAKGTGFDPKMLKRVIALRKQDKAKRQEEEEILGLYLAALGME